MSDEYQKQDLPEVHEQQRKLAAKLSAAEGSGEWKYIPVNCGDYVHHHFNVVTTNGCLVYEGATSEKQVKNLVEIHKDALASERERVKALEECLEIANRSADDQMCQKRAAEKLAAALEADNKHLRCIIAAMKGSGTETPPTGKQPPEETGTP